MVSQFATCIPSSFLVLLYKQVTVSVALNFCSLLITFVVHFTQPCVNWLYYITLCGHYCLPYNKTVSIQAIHSIVIAVVFGYQLTNQPQIYNVYVQLYTFINLFTQYSQLAMAIYSQPLHIITTVAILQLLIALEASQMNQCIPFSYMLGHYLVCSYIMYMATVRSYGYYTWLLVAMDVAMYIHGYIHS